MTFETYGVVWEKRDDFWQTFIEPNRKSIVVYTTPSWSISASWLHLYKQPLQSTSIESAAIEALTICAARLKEMLAAMPEEVK